MAQPSRGRSAASEDSGLVPSTHMAAHTICTSSSRDPVLTSVNTKHIHGIHAFTQAKHSYT